MKFKKKNMLYIILQKGARQMIKKEILKPILRYLDFLLNTTLYSRLISQDSKIFDRNDYAISNLDLIFIHVMKTGGTSFVQILKEVEKKRSKN